MTTQILNYQLVERMSEQELAEALDALVERIGHRLSRSSLIGLAVKAVALHPGLRGRDRELRSLLATEAAWEDIAEQLAGEPRSIVDARKMTDSSLRQARIAGEAMSAIWDEEMLPSSEVARRLGASPSNREKVNTLRRRSVLLGLPRDGGRKFLFPAFQIDAGRQEVDTQVREVNQILDAASDPWGVASWWVSTHGRLGARAMDLVGTPGSGALIEAARSMVGPIG